VEKLLDAIDGMIGDASQDVAQVTFRIESVYVCSSDQAVYGRCTFPTAIGASEKKVLSPKRNNAQRSFRSVMPGAGLCCQCR
jgi:hypothetical protein